jgi:hypothetical protein
LMAENRRISQQISLHQRWEREGQLVCETVRSLCVTLL